MALSYTVRRKTITVVNRTEVKFVISLVNAVATICLNQTGLFPNAIGYYPIYNVLGVKLINISAYLNH